MRTRTLACALLIGATTALAAPPKEAPAATQDIDVDALARAKDVDAKATTADVEPVAPEELPAEAAEAAAEAAKATEATAASAAAGTPVDTATAKAPVKQADVPAVEAKPAAPPADAAPVDVDATGKTDSEASPAPIAQTEEQRHAASCIARASSLLDAAQKGDYVAATQDFDAKMSSALSPAQFGKAWGQLDQFGKLKARGQSHPIKGEGYIAVTIPLIFEKKNLYAQVACGNDGRIAGFYVKPLDVPAP